MNTELLHVIKVSEVEDDAIADVYISTNTIDAAANAAFDIKCRRDVEAVIAHQGDRAIYLVGSGLHIFFKGIDSQKSVFHKNCFTQLPIEPGWGETERVPGRQGESDLRAGFQLPLALRLRLPFQFPRIR